jgi:hypothetical protein
LSSDRGFRYWTDLDKIFVFIDDIIVVSLGQIIVGENVNTVRQVIPISITLGVE